MIPIEYTTTPIVDTTINHVVDCWIDNFKNIIHVINITEHAHPATFLVTLIILFVF